jgi:hypothetical protein
MSGPATAGHRCSPGERIYGFFGGGFTGVCTVFAGCQPFCWLPSVGDCCGCLSGCHPFSSGIVGTCVLVLICTSLFNGEQFNRNYFGTHHYDQTGGCVPLSFEAAARIDFPCFF